MHDVVRCVMYACVCSSQVRHKCSNVHLLSSGVVKCIYGVVRCGMDLSSACMGEGGIFTGFWPGSVLVDLSRAASTAMQDILTRAQSAYVYESKTFRKT
jgi:hypothetical protein